MRGGKEVASIRGHDTEILSFDWGKYKPNTVVTGSVDKTVKYWDLRNPSIPVVTLVGHEYAVRKVRMSPFGADIVGSVSYDMTLRLWNLALGTSILVDDFHSEFATGMDFSLFNNSILTTGWDEMARIRPTI
jgi:peroxin-7